MSFYKIILNIWQKLRKGLNIVEQCFQINKSSCYYLLQEPETITLQSSSISRRSRCPLITWLPPIKLMLHSHVEKVGHSWSLFELLETPHFHLKYTCSLAYTPDVHAKMRQHYTWASLLFPHNLTLRLFRRLHKIINKSYRCWSEKALVHLKIKSFRLSTPFSIWSTLCHKFTSFQQLWANSQSIRIFHVVSKCPSHMTHRLEQPTLSSLRVRSCWKTLSTSSPKEGPYFGGELCIL